MIPYFIAFLVLGIPIGWAEWTMGRYGGRKGFHSAPAIMGLWGKGPVARYVGALGVLIPIAVYFYYVIIESWCLCYAWNYLTGGIGVEPAAEVVTQVETSKSFFADVTFSSQDGFLADGKIQWSATWFESEFRNAIDFDSGPPPMLVNRNRVDTDGVELAGRYAVSDAWAVDGSVTHAKSRIESTGGELRNRPDWRGGVGVHFSPLAALRFSASATYVGESFDSSIATGDLDLDAYTRLDVSAVWQLSEKFETWLAIDNLTDEKYQQFVGFESRGMLPRAGVRFTL
jgi:hypothetical protein